MGNKKKNVKVCADRISDMYKSLGISQAELARRVHMVLWGGDATAESAKHYVSDFNKLIRKEEMSASTVEAISEVLCCDADYILGMSDTETENTTNREELLNETYLSRKDIKILLGKNTSRQDAERIFKEADRIESQMRFRAKPNKVMMQTVLKVTEISWDLLRKQIKNADALAQQSAK